MGATCLATFVPPDLGSFCRLDELGLQVVGQRLEPGRVVLACRVVETDEFARWCCRGGCEAAPRDSVTHGWRISRWGVAPDDVAHHDPSLSLHRLLARVAPGHQPGRALGFRNLTNYIARSLLEAGEFRPRLHPRLR
jgi:hypothetical protein